MTQTMRFAIAAAAAILFAMNADAQEKKYSFRDSYRKWELGLQKVLMSGLDTNYISLPSTNWEVFAVVNNTGFQGRATRADGMPFSYRSATTDTGISIGYHGLDLVYTFPLDNRNSSNFYFDYFDNYWGLMLNAGTDRTEMGDGSSNLKFHNVTIGGYYAFFGNRYSHPATVYGNYIQKRSAGSPLITAWYLYNRYFGENALIHQHQGVISGGYGYNLVFNEGATVLNVNGCAGFVIPSPGLAYNVQASAVFRLSESFRFNIILTDYGQFSWDGNPAFPTTIFNNWRASLGLYYCFGTLK